MCKISSAARAAYPSTNCHGCLKIVVSERMLSFVTVEKNIL